MIWVIGGTKDSREFIEMFPHPENLIVTTATEYGRELLAEYTVRSLAQRLDYKAMIRFVQEERIEKIVDLSHPYAREVSSNAISISQELNIPYLRFERAEIKYDDLETKSFSLPEEIAKYIEILEGNILITLGSNTLEKFSNLKNLRNLYFRVLPTPEVLEKCRNLGISPKNILALQGPFSENMNKAMIEEYKIKYLITKYSGKTSGEKEKVEACRKTGTKILYLNKPSLKYDSVFNSLEELIKSL